MENTSKKSISKKSRKLVYALVVIIAAIIIIGSLYYYETTLKPSADSGTPMTLYEGEISATSYGFGNSATSLMTNPGPTITLTASQTYTMTIHNVGNMQHNWAISKC